VLVLVGLNTGYFLYMVGSRAAKLNISDAKRTDLDKKVVASVAV